MSFMLLLRPASGFGGPAFDPCLLAPLTFAVTRWPSATAGSRRLDYRWTGMGPITITFTATMATARNVAGCERTVTKEQP